MLHIFLFYIIGQEQRSNIMDENFRFIRNYHLDFKFHDDPVACQTYPFTGWNGPMLKFSLSLIHNASLMASNFSAYKLLKCLGILISKLHCRYLYSILCWTSRHEKVTFFNAHISLIGGHGQLRKIYNGPWM